jgi:hypothetical protein
MNNEGTCGHEQCDCPASESGYCSDHCKEAVKQDITEIRCDCGHDGCEN